MTHRERLLNVLNYRPVDRGIYGIWIGAWPETIERWRGEGYDPAQEPLYDKDRWLWHGGWFFPNPPFTRTVIEEDEKTVLYINHEGILLRERKDNPYSSMPQFIRFPAETREEFRRFARERLQPDLAARLGADYIQQLTALRERDEPLIVISDRWGGFFGGLRNLVGVEKLCMLFYDDPAFVEEMMDTIADFIIAIMGQVLDHTTVDVYGFWEDMAYKTAPLISPELVRTFMLPRYRRVIDYLRSRGVEWFALDSDGDITSLIPVWLDAGINILYPFEAQCGMDVVQVRQQYGRDLRMWFGMNKRALVEGPAAIDAELRRIRPLIEEGGYVPGLDHSIPPDVPFAHYQYFMDAFRKAVEL
ncbi:MAG TPA: uroporphyrinogen decarboxylase family protein [Armatimonadota bacterium]|jgi:uroporphyrinogen decarboxylase